MSRWLAAVVVILALASCSSACTRARRFAAPVMPADEVQRRLAIAARANPPAYYLGETYRGLEISDVSIDSHFVSVSYGTCEITSGEEGGCLPPYQVVTEAFANEGWTIAAGCSRLRDIRGVPAVSWGGGTQLIFGTTLVKVFPAGDSGASAAAAQVRPIGGSLVARLHRPNSATLAVIGKACGDRPGQHGQNM